MRYVEPPPIIELAGTPEGSTIPVDSVEMPGTALPPEPPPEPLPEVKPIPIPIPFPQPR
jgi:hypothetical protein